MKSVLVSHPHAKPDAQGVAASLEKAGLLGAFVTGIAANPGTLRGWGLRHVTRFVPQASNRTFTGVPSSRLYSLAGIELAARGLGKAISLTGDRASAGYDCLYIGHDLAVAVMPWPHGIDGVYAYEDGALRTFRRALRKAIPRVWDLPTPHYTYVESMLKREATRWPDIAPALRTTEPGRRQRRKDAELKCATHAVVASQFTADSLKAAGAQLPTRVVPYGFPVDSFPCKSRAPSGPFMALAVGNHTVRKGTHYLLEAWRLAALKDARLRLVGRLDLPQSFLGRYAGMYEHVPYLPKSRLIAEYHAADILVFPTLADGFGLVIQEAMCSGTPVITTPCSGGPECLASGVEGCLIPEANVDALVEALRHAARDRGATYKMGQAARRRAESYTWHDSSRLLVTFISQV